MMPSITPAPVDMNPDILVIGGQDLRFLAEKKGGYSEIVSYEDDSFLIAIDTELVVEVDDAESFVKNNVKIDLIKYLPGNFFDYKSRDDENISIRIEPYHGKYRVHLYHSE